MMRHQLPSIVQDYLQEFFLASYYSALPGYYPCCMSLRGGLSDTNPRRSTAAKPQLHRTMQLSTCHGPLDLLTSHARVLSVSVAMAIYSSLLCLFSQHEHCDSINIAHHPLSYITYIEARRPLMYSYHEPFYSGPFTPRLIILTTSFHPRRTVLRLIDSIATHLLFS